LIGSRLVVAYGNETYRRNLKKLMWLYRENHQEKAVTAESVRRELKP
jgi:hypothetical protein